MHADLTNEYSLVTHHIHVKSDKVDNLVILYETEILI